MKNSIKLITIAILSLALVFYSLSSSANANANLQKGLEWKNQGNFEQAIKYFEIAKTENAADPSILKEYANASFELKKYGQAIPVYESLLNTDKKNPEYLIRLARMYSFSSQKYKSIDYAEQAMKLKPTDKKDIEILAEVFFFNKHYPKAIDLYNTLGAKDFAGLNRIAQCYNKMQSFSNSIKVYEEIMKLNDVPSTAHYEYAVALYNAGNYTESVNQFSMAEKKGYTNMQSLFQNTALAYQEMKNFDKALESFNKAKLNDPFNKNLNLNIADCMIRADKLAEARDVLDAMMKYLPNDAELIYQYGMTYYKAGNKTKAETYFNQAFVLNPSLKSLRYTKNTGM